MVNSKSRLITLLLVACLAAELSAQTGESFSDTWSFPLIQNTFFLAFCVSALTIPIGIPLAFLVARTDLICRRAIEIVLYAMLFIPAYLHVAAWDAGFGLQGWVSQRIGPGTVLLEGWRGAIWIYFVTVLPWVVLIQAACFRLVPGDLEDQARIDSSQLQVVLRVTFRLALPGVVASLFWILIQVANEVTITDVYQIRTYAEEIYTGFALGDTLAEAQIRILPGACLICLLAACAYYLISVASAPRANSSFDAPSEFSLGKWRQPISYLVIGFLAMMIAVPIFNLVWKAGVVVKQTDVGRVRTWEVLKCMRMVVESPVKFSTEIAWSITLGQLASVSAVIIAFLIAWRIEEKRLNRIVAALLLLTGLSIPGPILALAVARVLNLPFMPAYFYNHSIIGVWFVLTVRTFPIAFFLVYLAVRSLDRSIIESSRVDGANVVQQIFLIGLPMISYQLVGAWLVSLIWSMGELSASILITPPGVDTLSKSIFDLVHYGVEDRLAGICLFSVGAFISLASLGIRFARTAAVR